MAKLCTPRPNLRPAAHVVNIPFVGLHEDFDSDDMHRGRVIAVIDVGSNSVRLLVARQLSGSAFEVMDEARYDARLGQGQVDGNLSLDGMERGMRAMRIVSEVAESYHPVTTVVAGTEALRRAPNADQFIERVRAELGVELNVLPAEEEARASFLGAMNSTSVEDGHLVDIGGGSLEVVTIRAREAVKIQSVPLGALYATERYLLDDRPTARQVRTLRKAVGKMIEVEQEMPLLVGAGGAVRNLARLYRLRTSYPLRRLHGMEMPAREVALMARQLVSVPVAARKKIPGVSPNRVDTLHAAAVVLDEVTRLVGASHLVVAGQGMREGLLWQAIRPFEPILPNVRRSSIDGLARANNVDEHSSEPVEQTAAEIFDATAVLHGFGPEELELLMCAARLAGIGMHIDYYNRDRHAEYLVHSGDLHGFSHREIVLLAALVRCADSGTPSLAEYTKALQPDDDRRAGTLAVILGLARAINRRRPTPVTRVQMEIRPNREARLVLRSDAPLDAETNALESQLGRFEAIFGLPLTVQVRDGQAGASARRAAG